MSCLETLHHLNRDSSKYYCSAVLVIVQMKEHSLLFFVIIVIICQQQSAKTQSEKEDGGKKNVKCKDSKCDDNAIDVDIDYDYDDTFTSSSQALDENFPADFDFLPVSYNANKEPKFEKTSFEGIQYPFLVRIGIRNES